LAKSFQNTVIPAEGEAAEPVSLSDFLRSRIGLSAVRDDGTAL
jgi:hypothetical protein